MKKKLFEVMLTENTLNTYNTLYLEVGTYLLLQLSNKNKP